MHPDKPNAATLLSNAHTIAFVGISDKPDRYSNKVATYFAQKGCQIIPVNPNIRTVLGQKVYANLLEVPRQIHIDIIAIYRNSNQVLEHLHETQARGNVGSVWLAEGVHSRSSEAYAATHNIVLITDRCLMKVDQAAQP